ncbi:MAG TPA: GntR family transcriptional regulator [Acidimicrobiales bacterium]|nr:GntR family transcriptional regulator [Acidimicrobiales bacterium]
MRIAGDVLRDRIVQGHYGPGEHLPTAEIAAELGISRTPVREALLVLESEGLVVSSLNRGSRVRPLTAAGISQMYDLRAMLESFAARKAAERIGDVGPGAVEALNRRIADLDELLAADDLHRPEHIKAMMAANVDIHEAIVAASGYPSLPGLIAQTIDRGVIFRAYDLFGRVQLLRSNVFHRMVADVVIAGDGERAASLMAEHVFQSRDVVLERIEQAGGDVGAVFGGGRRAAATAPGLTG